MTKRKTWKRRIGFGLLLASLAASTLLAVGPGSAAASPVANDKATGACWKDVVNDWLQHQPNVKGSYPIPCYTQAIQHLDRYPDIQQYSNAPDDIHRALLAALAAKKTSPQSSGTQGKTTTASASGTSSSSGGGTNSGSKSSGSKSSGSKSSGTKSSGTTGGTASVAPVSKSFVTKLFDSVGPGNAQSIPLPLLVLAGLAILLLLAAIGTWLAKRIQARRMTPAPAPTPPRPPGN